VRHPRYSGAILTAFGLSLTFDSWLGLVGSATFIAIILFRIRDEEALMGEAFGDEWDAYCERTPRLIPFLY
jgi:protein-S-isoprenylcysteine O-methyltransferase Ste14